jgi:hypothetical protein
VTKLDDDQVMAYPQKLVENTILNLSDPLNEHLVKLVGFDFSDELRGHFRREIRTWLRKIQRLRIKPTNRTGSFKFYFDLLFDYPFGGTEIRNMGLIMDDIVDNYSNVHVKKTPEEMVSWLQDFHMRLAERLHDGEDVLDMIPE